MKLYRDINVSQPTVWFMLHRIRKAWMHNLKLDISGPVDIDESLTLVLLEEG